jgi:hypothetical protein
MARIFEVVHDVRKPYIDLDFITCKFCKNSPQPMWANNDNTAVKSCTALGIQYHLMSSIHIGSEIIVKGRVLAARLGTKL